MSESRPERPRWDSPPCPPGDSSPVLRAGAHPAVLDFEDVRRLLAHRFPMLMVDRVTAFEPGRSISVIKQVSGNEIFFVGHFPRQAVFPGALIAESMAQASALLFVLSRPAEVSNRSRRALKVLHKMTVTFVHPVFPGDTLHVRSEAVKIIDHALITKVVATVDGLVVAKGELALGETFRLSRPHEQ